MNAIHEPAATRFAALVLIRSLQAAIAAIHNEAPTAEHTDWQQIVALYELLKQFSDDNPVVALNHAVAVAVAMAMAAGGP